MQFQTKSKSLLAALKIGLETIPANTVMPITNCFLLTLKGNELTIKTSDLESFTKTKIEVEGEADGECAVGSLLEDTLKMLPSQVIQFEHSFENQAIDIKCPQGHYKLGGLNPKDFPKFPEEEYLQSASISAPVLIESFTKTSFATADHNDPRVSLQGVLVDLNNNELVVTATNAQIMSKYKYVFESGSEKRINVLLPKRSCNIVSKLFTDHGYLKFSISAKNAFFERLDTIFSCRLIDARIIDFSNVIPVKFKSELTIPRLSLLSCLKRVDIYGSRVSRHGTLKASAGKVTIDTVDSDFATDATETIDGEITGDKIHVSFKVSSLIEMLNVLTCDKVLFKFGSERSPIVFGPSDQSGSELSMLMMPVVAVK